MDTYISWGEDNPVAVQTARVLLFFQGELTDSKAQAKKLYDAFLKAAGDEVRLYSIRGPRQPKKLRPFDARKADEFFSSAALQAADGLRLYGELHEALGTPNVPFLSIEQFTDTYAIEMALPVDAPLPQLARAIEGNVGDSGLLSGAIGFGYFLPPASDSVARCLVDPHRRYRCAILVRPSMVHDGVLPSEYLDEWANSEPPGLVDIGWKTLIGRQFKERLGPILPDLIAIPGVAVDEIGDVTVLTIGEHPIWGDVNHDEDITPYRAVAKALRALEMPRALVENLYFGGDLPRENLSYLDRFEEVP